MPESQSLKYTKQEQVKLTNFNFSVDFEKTDKLSSEVVSILKSNLIILSPHSKALGFSELLEEIFDLCYERLEEFEFHDKIFKIELKILIQQVYLKIQNYLNG